MDVACCLSLTLRLNSASDYTLRVCALVLSLNVRPSYVGEYGQGLLVGIFLLMGANNIFIYMFITYLYQLFTHQKSASISVVFVQHFYDSTLQNHIVCLIVWTRYQFNSLMKG